MWVIGARGESNLVAYFTTKVVPISAKPSLNFDGDWLRLVSCVKRHIGYHDVQFSCAINQPLLAHHWRVHQCLLTSRFIAPSILWGVSAPGGRMRRQLLKNHNFLNNSPIFSLKALLWYILASQKALHTIHFNLTNCFGFGKRYLLP